MKNATNTSHTDAFAHITKFYDAQKHESKRADQSAYDAMCELMRVDACLFAAPSGFSAWTTERQMAKVAIDFGLVLDFSVSINMEVSA